MGSGSSRRIALGVGLLLLLWADASVAYNAFSWIALGEDFGALGVPNVGVGMAVGAIPVFLVLLWLTYRVWTALRES